MSLSSTLFPQPEGPSSARISPRRTSRSSPLNTSFGPKRFHTSRSFSALALDVLFLGG